MPADLDAEVEKELKRLLRRKSPPPRTSTILQELWAGIDSGRTVTAEHVKAWAMVLRVKLARGALPGQYTGGGRAKGQRDVRPRAQRSDLDLELRQQVRARYAQLQSLRKTGAEFGLSAERIRQLLSDDV